ncbi:hypothetical protein AAG570_013829 [Ranatra chinensis]|uniref:C2H2-type domain-containing protein n=1 Tax=Ranatra chinensis TaxID=642074 RepID=A0ABD0YDB4_9HEMI
MGSDPECRLTCQYAVEYGAKVKSFLSRVGVPRPVGGSNEGKEFACAACGRTYRHQSSLRSHMRYECGRDRHLACQYCQYRTHQKSNLKAHVIRMHVAEYRSRKASLNTD